MSGIFYGIGVGPGDPELLTIKAARLIRECDVLAVAVSGFGLCAPVFEEAGEKKVPGQYLDHCVAYQIVLGAVPEAAEKDKLYLPMPMVKDKERLKQIHDACADCTQEQLRRGRSVAFITLGDPTVYSTCLYVHKRLKRRGADTRLIPGIPSFCAAAARMDTGLAENKEELHIIPASYGVEESLGLPGTKVLMKAGRKMPEVKQAVRDRGLAVQMVENCGMDNEHIYWGTEEIPEDAGYYSLVIVKEGK
ncbi:precorrin-2 C(20)-methyltransferase [Luxibacter massiliensis]|uniref:precorrin-2 C(20)-methyltransferase n=1 Tax=Luxibacter massiliensis TaxID=2219695 RepID=UPI000F048377|nr:precorrin-2 C(20)-methyltransferase [Luxibacter massiliensis]